MSGSMPAAARTDVGLRREHNEDAMLLQPPVLAVADGVGGSAKGEVASRTALDTFALHADRVARAATTADAVREMEAAVLAANGAVHEAQLRNETLRGMATTLTAAIVRDGGELVVGHVGDSRLYVLSTLGARTVTEDHSVVAELVRSGRLAPQDASSHPQRNVITRALGPEPDVSVDAFATHVGPGDWLLACSDGLTEHVHDDELARVVLEHGRDPDRAVAALVELANERGGSDNITVIVAQPVPSDVSGELSIEALHVAAAATATQTASVPPAGRSDAPADDSGPLPAVAGPTIDARGELPTLQPLDGGFGAVERPTGVDHDGGGARGGARGWLLLLVAMLVAALIGVVVWSQSYFLLEREDGRVGINRGFPIARLAQPHKTSAIAAQELDPADRERLVDSHRILSREDAERVLAELPDRVDGALDAQREEPDGDATSP